jgi:hypothetical protein
MRQLIHLMTVTVACCGPLTASAEERRFTCPERLAPETVQPNHPPAGWALYLPRGARLTGAGMLHGAPDQSGYMVPDDSKLTKSGKSSTQTDSWTFPAPQDYPTWIYCGYGGAGAPLQLFKRVADDATQCTLTSKSKDGLGKDVAEFVCK